MSYIVGLGIGLGSLVVIALLTGWALLTAWTRGVVYSHRVGYDRESDPANFWFYTCGYAVAFVVSAGLLAFFSFEALVR